MGNNEPAVDQSDLRICGSYGLKHYIAAHAAHTHKCHFNPLLVTSVAEVSIIALRLAN